MPVDTRREIRDAALGMLARREHSAFELMQKLLAKGYAAETVGAELARLAETGLQSDERFAESFVRWRKGRGQGPVRIAQELKQRGVDASLLDQHLDRNDEDWYTLCAEVARSRFGRQPAQDFREKAQRMRFLQYRGFSSAQISRCLRGGADNNDEIDES